MTIKQKKGIGAAALSLLFLLLVIGTFDSQKGYLAAKGESKGIASPGNLNLRKAEASLPGQRLAATHAPPKIVKHKRVKPAPTLWESPHNRGDDPHPVKKPVPAPKPKDPGHPEGPGEINDGNNGHGNDDDGHDEDNDGNSRHDYDGDKGKDHGNDELGPGVG